MEKAVEDPDEEMLVDLTKLYGEALDIIRTLWPQAETTGRDPLTLVLDLSDARGRVLLTVPFADILAADRVRSH